MPGTFTATTTYHLIYDPVASPITVDLLPGQVIQLPYETNYVASGWYNRGGYTWPDNPAVGPFGGDTIPTGFIVQTLGTTHATENQDGTGAAYDLEVVLSGGAHETIGPDPGEEGDYFSGYVGLTILNPTGRTLYASTMTATGWRTYQIVTTTTVDPPSNIGPTIIPPPTNLPPEVVARKLLEKANPGLTSELLRWNKTADLTAVRLGHKISLTVEVQRGKLGMHGRGYVITRCRLRWRAEANPVRETLEITYGLEKVTGTILGGAGSSTSDQDDAYTGGDLSLYAKWDTAGAGWGSGWAA